MTQFLANLAIKARENKLRTALIIFGVLIFCWDWFVLPRLIIAFMLPILFLLLPIVLLAAPIILVVMFVKRRQQAQAAEDARMYQALQSPVIPHHPVPGQHSASYAQPVVPPQPTHPPQAHLRNSEEAWNLYESYPEMFEGIDFGDGDPRA